MSEQMSRGKYSIVCIVWCKCRAEKKGVVICECQSILRHVLAHKAYVCVAYYVFVYVDFLHTVCNMSCACGSCGQASCHTAVSCDLSV